MSDVDESENKRKTLGEDPIMLDELDEDEIKHNPFEVRRV
jgi:hypothetical protein